LKLKDATGSISETKVKSIFELYDADDSGHISVEDLKEGLTSLELNTNSAKDRRILEALIVYLLKASGDSFIKI
jgi:Ca2+-binding EF-hand superfamily protein